MSERQFNPAQGAPEAPEDRAGDPGETAAQGGRAAVLVFMGAPRSDAVRWGWGPSGPAARANLSKHVLDRLVRSPLREHPAARAADVLVFYDEAMGEQAVPAGVHGCHRQHGSGFAERLLDAVSRVWKMGYDRVVIVGTDVPHLGGRHVRTALGLLQGSPLVVGPDAGGGCYLIALRRGWEGLLARVEWGRNTDFAELLRLGGSRCVAMRQVLRDLDGPDTIRHLCRRGLPGWLRYALARVVKALERAAGLGIRAARECDDALPPVSALATGYRNTTGPPGWLAWAGGRCAAQGVA